MIHKNENGIQEKLLQEVIDFIDGDRGTNYPSQGEFLDNGYCLFLSTKNVPNTKFSFEEKVFIDKEKDYILRKGKLRRGDFVLTTRGTVGNFAYYNHNIPYENVRINSGMVILRKKSDELIEEFFRYYLSSSSFSGQVRSRVSGSAQPQLPIRDMVSMKINLPNKEKQIKIASILSSYDDLIEKNEKRIKILEEVAQLLYHEWFVKFRFPGHESVKMVESNSKYGNIPEGWKLGRLGEIVDIIRTPAQAGEHLKGRQYVPIENISKKSFIIKESSSWMEAQSSLILFEKNDILFGAMRPYFHKVSVASNPGVTRTTCLVLRPKKEFLLSFSFLSVFSNDFVNFASSNTQGATIPYAVWENSLENYKILIPTNQYLMEFETINKRLVYQIRVLVEANNILSKTRDLLIPQLVTGKKLLLNL